ncbi:hypothetical protein O181_020583 [Austropuccinia psidii MF-1]|uniref:Uncharacterized protein n=1 Tax=Austropuccinia psidii MF-1 TaxID=1389203 RepID=A0A9Q3CD74_9BASI|nr:hypothetical protein [Austropuccinia psidii MF-1]
MEATIQTNKMDLDKEDARTRPGLAGLPKERNIKRVPEFPSISQGKNNQTVTSLEPITFQGKGQKDKESVEEQNYLICRPKEGTEIHQDLEKEEPVVSISFKPAPELHKDKPKRPQKMEGSRKNQGEVQCKANSQNPTHKGT